ncbi:helix-turn-helix domain-containing protein [Glycomyces sp. TRM65418]|uniref:GlxA family transcriptional regulator n=1 Tax=Glycomyces sp. TRM65418 TaxID=2867006 RepID=UPI001CE5938D|nr:helix-turn-helix domain-containing protein [Glycomyces sp. TRM65418]MCC3762005.1 helix-turn-helix domain-containing protein [Glycomyces sp. TRM65418]QZD56080.1 helix-turn-helix domain-containing protein [Glycomyces sp. TRM65418]
MANSHRVAVLALDRVMAFELGTPDRILSSAVGDDSARLYDVRVCTLDGGPVRTSSGFAVLPGHGPELLAWADTVIVATIDDDGPFPDVQKLAEAFATIRADARIVSFCSAAFVLAELGLLDGKSATTHWVLTDRMRERYPKINVDPDVLFVDAGRILTSAGAGAAVDLCLHLVRLDHGSAVANAVARRCVVPPWREGGQAQFIERPVPDERDLSTSEARAWALANLDRPLSIDELARRANMSRRSFTRRFRDETGQSPAQWLTRQRVEHARHLLEATDLTVDQIAQRAGLGTGVSLRQHLRAALGVSPSAYRRTFRRNGFAAAATG